MHEPSFEQVLEYIRLATNVGAAGAVVWMVVKIAPLIINFFTFVQTFQQQFIAELAQWRLFVGNHMEHSTKALQLVASQVERMSDVVAFCDANLERRIEVAKKIQTTGEAKKDA